MTDDDWEKQRQRVILAAFQTGRPVFADTEGVLRYADGDKEDLPVEVGVPQAPLPVMVTRAPSLWSRLKQKFRKPGTRTSA